MHIVILYWNGSIQYVFPYPSRFLTPEKFEHVCKEFHNDLIVALVIISDVLKWDNECYLLENGQTVQST